jgi:DNA-binding transcriptional regulator PaaX
LEQHRLIKRHGDGTEVRFTVTATGIARAHVTDPIRNWNRPWDGLWRVFGYDLPMPRRRDRQVLWRALRAKKFGLLQQSIWVWPHDVEATLLELVQAENIPECFCGFEAPRVFLTSHRAIVRAAWDFNAINRCHRTYLAHSVSTQTAVKRAVDLSMLARLTQTERHAYRAAFVLDPLLPRGLWPKGYQGKQVEQRHQQFRAAIRQRIHKLAG